MKYENRQPAEGINVSRVHPLKQVLALSGAALVLIVVTAFVLQLSGAAIAKRIPFSYELRIMERLDIPFGDTATYPDITRYLNELASQMISHMDLPEGMTVDVHYSPEKVFNAFATVGGNLLFYRGLLEEVPDENTLAMVMAHEIAHVLHRDPVAALGGGVASSIAMLALTGNAGTGVAGSVLNQAGVVTGIQFTRKMEEAADQQALGALYQQYGHVAGAAGLFELFDQQRGDSEQVPGWLERFLSTHPLDQDRINAVNRIAEEAGWPVGGERTPLPDEFNRWL